MTIDEYHQEMSDLVSRAEEDGFLFGFDRGVWEFYITADRGYKGPTRPDDAKVIW